MAKIPLTEYEVQLVRFCAQQYIEKGDILRYVDFPHYEELGRKKILEARDRFARFGLMRGDSDKGVRILPAVLELVEQWDNPPLPDYRDRLTKWFWSKPWSIVIYVLVVGVPAIVGWVVMVRTIVEWLSLTK